MAIAAVSRLKRYNQQLTFAKAQYKKILKNMV